MFEEIAGDSSSGASRLSRMAAHRLSEIAHSLSGSDPGAFWEGLVDACAELVAAKREMAPIVNLAGAVLAAAERVILSGRSAETAAQAVRLECGRVYEFGKERLRDLGMLVAELIPDGSVVATLSDGESVRAALEAALDAGKDFEVLVAESRPRLEGVSLAAHAAALGLPTTLTTDAALPGLLGRAGVLVMGADSISEDSLVNKVGSHAAALAAREAGVPAYAAALSDKLLPAALRGDPGRLHDGSEVLQEPVPGVAVANPYFETVPLGLFRAIVTEDGARAPEEVPELLRERPVSPALLQILFPRGHDGRP